MKKLIFVFAILFSVVCVFPVSRTDFASAASLTNADACTWFEAEYKSIILDESNVARFYDRTAGGSGERNFAIWLEERMASLGYLPNGTDLEHASFEYFDFESSIDGLTHRSQNVKFVKKGKNSDKKIVVGTCYDNAYGFASTAENALDIIGADASLNNVLVVLSVANQLADVELDFDVEIVFFGAGYHNTAGSKFYTLGIDKKENESILLALNIDDLSDDKLYFYDAEKDTKQGKFAQKVFDVQGVGIEKYAAGSSFVATNSDLYPFSHRALFSDNKPFLQSGVRTLSILTTSKDGYFGNEYYKEIEYDKFAPNAYPEFLNRAASVSVVLSQMICNESFVQNMTGSGEISEFWTDARWGVFATIVLLVVIFAIYELLYHKMMKDMRKKYSSATASQIIAEKVDEEIDKSDNAELERHRGEIREMFEQDICDKLGKDDEK